VGPKFCERCKHLAEDGSCRSAKHCTKWRAWFAREWARIRRAAEKIKKTNGGVPK